MRRSIVRYMNLAAIMSLRLMCLPVKKRFPTYDHLVEAGLLTEGEKKVRESNECTGHVTTFQNILQIIEKLDLNAVSNSKFWLPLIWAGSIVTRARNGKRITNDYTYKHLIERLDTYRGMIGGLSGYDWINVPLVYTQVVTLAVYTFVVSKLFGSQYLDPAKKYPDHDYDFYVPFFTLLQFFFYMGWLKVAEALINPFGEDDDDFDMNWFIDRNIQVSYLIVDDMHAEHPDLVEDPTQLQQTQ